MDDDWGYLPFQETSKWVGQSDTWIKTMAVHQLVTLYMNLAEIDFLREKHIFLLLSVEDLVAEMVYLL